MAPKSEPRVMLRVTGRDEDLRRVVIQWKRPQSELVEVIEDRLLEKTQSQMRLFLQASTGTWSRIYGTSRWMDLPATGVDDRHGLPLYEIEFVKSGGE